MFTRSWCGLLLVLVPPIATDASEPGDEASFESMFDGRTLAGWNAVPASAAADWSVRDGAIVGVGSADRQVYLVWRERDLADFDLRLRYRLLTPGNTGIEIRAQPDPSGRRPFVAYHADLGHVGIGPQVLGAWDFHFHKRKEHPCPLGTRLLIAEDGTAQSSPLAGAITVAGLHRDDWNDVRVVAHGNRCQFFINGLPASEFTDLAREGRPVRGAIGLQLHEAGMRVEFKDLRLKRL